MRISELLYALDCDCGDDLSILAQSERFGEEWFCVTGVIVDENQCNVTFVVEADTGQDVIRTSLFDGGIDGAWTEHVDDSPDNLYHYEVVLSFAFDDSRTLYPVGGWFSFSESEEDEEVFVMYPEQPARI